MTFTVCTRITYIVFVQSGAKINGMYYCDNVLKNTVKGCL